MVLSSTSRRIKSTESVGHDPACIKRSRPAYRTAKERNNGKSKFKCLVQQMLRLKIVIIVVIIVQDFKVDKTIKSFGGGKLLWYWRDEMWWDFFKEYRYWILMSCFMVLLLQFQSYETFFEAVYLYLFCILY